ncbi:hypothetical protein PsorP6_003691 [Peronosclerospora sorghi]|uniref:Uncharacterized protein n=1 Tax=Peronosclerospora sorghi TaxID=230839 RepID=A0ACC0VL07_9STRA|nr:hypothetical protein PsorP6_003691 [Peronosclerospora sorghi]
MALNCIEFHPSLIRRENERLDPWTLTGASSNFETPENKPNRKRRIVSSSYGGYCNSPSILDTPSPGKDERSKLGDHSVIKMTLHTSFGASPSVLDSHPTRGIRAINNSLYGFMPMLSIDAERKKYIRSRKAEENDPKKPSSSNVQCKFLQTTVKRFASPRRMSRSPLQPYNRQKTSPTPLKVALNEQDAMFVDDPTPSRVTRKLTDPSSTSYTYRNHEEARSIFLCFDVLSDTNVAFGCSPGSKKYICKAAQAKENIRDESSKSTDDSIQRSIR